MPDEGEIRESAPVGQTVPDRVAVMETISRAFRICYDNPSTFVGMAAIVTLPSFAMGLLAMARNPEAGASMGQGIVGLLFLVLVVAIFILEIYYFGALPLLTAFTLDNRPLGWTEAFGWIHDRRVFWGIFLCVLLQTLTFIGGLILLVIPGLLFGVWFMLSVPARVLGDHPGRQALSSSRRLVSPVLFRGAIGLAAVLVLVPLAIGGAAQGISWAVWGFASNVVPKVLITSIVNYALAVFWGPAAYVALAILYIERAGGLGSLRRDLFI